MKKCAYFLILIIAMVLSSCNGTVVTSANKNKDEFVTKKLQTVWLLDSTEKNSPKCEIDVSIDFVQSDDKERETKINNSILNAIFGYENVSVETAIDSFVANVHEEYVAMRPEYFNEKQINENAAWLNFSYIINTTIEYGRKDVINYIINNECYTGGANPNSACIIINFDAETGDEIKLNDIFKENYEEYLSGRLTDALAAKIGAGSRKEIKEKGYLTFNDIYPTENFIMKKDSILFYYNLYEIAPRSAGTTILGFTYDELSTIMK
ncbi:MAG: DUF3298 and DUF4163 domain-containing protein [Bacteroidales bacterium]|nr:DUF3298 and DUF4163 domain-containing protein [Bacteroidales bacterium]